MADFSIWPATNGPNTDQADATDISRGVLFRLSAPGWLKSIKFYRGTVNVGNHAGGAPIGRIYTVADGLPVASTDVTFTLSGTGWLTADVAVPVPLSANVSYKAVVLTQNYTATGGYWSVGAGVGGIVNGILTAPDAGGNPSGIGSIQQMSFKQPTAGLQYPTQYFNGGNYWVDVVIADEDPGDVIRDAAGSIAAVNPAPSGAGTKVGESGGGPAVNAALSGASSVPRTATSIIDEVTMIGTWLRTIAGVPPTKVNTVLPKVQLWADTGFVQIVGVVGGTPWIDAPVREAVIELDTWGAHLNSEKPDWGKASALMNLIVDAAQDPERSVGMIYTFPSGQRAQVKSLWPISIPRKPLSGIDQGDPASFARLMVDIQMIWAVLPD